MKYNHSLLLHKLYNSINNCDDWIDYNLQQNFNLRQPYLNIIDKLQLKIGKNLLSNKLKVVNNCIDYDWPNLHFKFEFWSNFNVDTNTVFNYKKQQSQSRNKHTTKSFFLNGLIPLPWLNNNIDTYKINIKKILL